VFIDNTKSGRGAGGFEADRARMAPDATGQEYTVLEPHRRAVMLQRQRAGRPDSSVPNARSESNIAGPACGKPRNLRRRHLSDI